MPLNAKQAAFVNEYLIDLNATQAAIRAGYSEKTARAQGNRLLTNADIQAAVKTRMSERAEKAALTAQEVLDGLRNEAEYYGEGNSHSARVSAWAHLGKHLGMFKEQQEHSGGINIRIIRE